MLTVQRNDSWVEVSSNPRDSSPDSSATSSPLTNSANLSPISACEIPPSSPTTTPVVIVVSSSAKTLSCYVCDNDCHSNCGCTCHQLSYTHAPAAHAQPTALDDPDTKWGLSLYNSTKLATTSINAELQLCSTGCIRASNWSELPSPPVSPANNDPTILTCITEPETHSAIANHPYNTHNKLQLTGHHIPRPASPLVVPPCARSDHAESLALLYLKQSCNKHESMQQNNEEHQREDQCETTQGQQSDGDNNAAASVDTLTVTPCLGEEDSSTCTSNSTSHANTAYEHLLELSAADVQLLADIIHSPTLDHIQQQEEEQQQKKQQKQQWQQSLSNQWEEYSSDLLLFHHTPLATSSSSSSAAASQPDPPAAATDNAAPDLNKQSLHNDNDSNSDNRQSVTQQMWQALQRVVVAVDDNNNNNDNNSSRSKTISNNNNNNDNDDSSSNGSSNDSSSEDEEGSSSSSTPRLIYIHSEEERKIRQQATIQETLLEVDGDKGEEAGDKERGEEEAAHTAEEEDEEGEYVPLISGANRAWDNCCDSDRDSPQYGATSYNDNSINKDNENNRNNNNNRNNSSNSSSNGSMSVREAAETLFLDMFGLYGL